MKPALVLMLIGSLIATSGPISASGPIERSATAHVLRLAAAASQTGPPVAASSAVELRWNELGPVVAGQRVTAVLSDGSRVTGDAVVVRDDALVMDVKRSTGSGAYAGGNAPIPRSAIAGLEIERHTGAGRALGTVLGVLAGVVIGGWVTAETTDSAGAGIPLFLGVASGITIAGYYAGKAVSKKVTIIRVTPSPAPPTR